MRDVGGLDVEALRAETPGCSNRIHLNNAGASLVPRPVLDAMIGHLQLEAEIGGYEAADAMAGRVAEYYTATAALLGCRSDNVAFAASATDAFSRALSSIPFERGDVVLTTRDDYISNQIAYLSLRRRFGIDVVHASNAPAGEVDVDAMAALMRSRRPRLVVVTHVPTSSGLVQPVAAIGRLCRELDLPYLVDACQSAGQYPLDVEEIGCDFLSATWRKFLRGPRGAGLLYVSDRALAQGCEPLFIDMRGARWVAAGAYEPAAGASRFEEWERSYAAVLGGAAAARYALAVGIEASGSRARALAARLRGALAGVDGVRVLDRGSELCAIVTIEIAGREARPFQAALGARGINASTTLREHAVYDFDEKRVAWCLRLSPHYYNTESEIDEAARVVAELARAGAATAATSRPE
ncbi:MAG: aminotransferase class V-fold PLP-dependent enzyme [Chloroflexi bacterium]|nr:MAG: aminotransferase class V-fold PLP-dependent enzyme [Chloroflexota bacterium]